MTSFPTRRSFDLGVFEGVVGRLTEIGRKVVTGPEGAAGPRLVVGALVVLALHPEQVEAGGDVAPEEVGLGERDVVFRRARGPGHAEPQVLAAAEQVALTDADVADDRVHRGIADAERDLSGRLLLDRHLDGGAVGEIGSASGRARVCPYVWNSVVPV